MDTTSTFTSTIQILLMAGNLLFNFWFLAILAPLSRRGKVGLSDIFVAWVILAIVRVLIVFSPQPMSSMFVHEPLNTILFACSGLILLIGTLIWRRIKNKNFQMKANSLRQIEDFLKLSPREFEDMIVELYTRAGHKAKRTGATGDHGVDVVVEAKNGEKWVVQCKRWKGSVGEPIVRDLYGVVQHEKADKGIIFTTGYFTASAQEWTKGKPITLYGGNKLVEIWSRAKARQDQMSQTSSSLVRP